MKNDFEFDGTWCSEIANIYIEKLDNLKTSSRSYEEISIKGRNGNLLIDNGNYENIEIPVDVKIKAKKEEWPEIARRFATWLKGSVEYKKIVFSNDLEYYREGFCSNKLDIERTMSNLGKMRILFNCKPFKKSFYGENLITITSHASIYNDECIESRPYIKVYGQGDITININNQSLILKGVEGFIEVDSDEDEMNCFKTVNGIITYQNDRMYSSFPVLQPGENSISWLGNVSKIEIIPRWNTL